MRALVVLLVLAMPAAMSAGTEMHFRCRNCGLKDTYGTGGGFFFYEFPAFCRGKNHFVSIAWERGKPRPQPVRRVRDVLVYTCRICKTPTAQAWDETACPRCGSKRIQTRATGAHYD